MKTTLSTLTKIILSTLFLIIISRDAHSQDTSSTLFLKNITYPDSRTMEFEIWFQYTGNVDQKFTYFQAGIDFNYAGMANGGTLTGAFVSASADASLPPSQKAPNWNINQSSKQIRMLAAIQTPEAGATPIPPPPGFRLGKFRMKGSVDLTVGSTPNFVFKFNVGTSTVTQTKVGAYLSGNTIATDITTANTQVVDGNPPVPGGTCSVTATIDQNVAPSCLAGSNGSAQVTLTGTGVTSTGTYVLDALPAAPYTTNPFTITGLSAGAHTITVTTTTPCTSNTAQFNTSPGADSNDNDICTIDACNSATGVTHTPVATDDSNPCTTDGCNSTTGVFHNPVPTDDSNACTTDACNTTNGQITHTAVSVDDQNACTLDACNSTNGQITHNAISTEDNNACTTDGCNSIAGVFHIPVGVDDQNQCTTDACNSTTGAITHTPINFDDGNVCTTDGCNSVTGVFHNPTNVDDQNPCTTDACNSVSGGITHTPVNTDDGNVCTTDACNSTTGVITHTPTNVDDQNVCTTDACNSTTGAITHTAVSTEDNNPCTTDGCNSVTGVFHTPVATDDQNSCTTDACNSTSGAITHTPVAVDDQNVCTTDACNSTNGQITHTAVSTEDNNPCTTDGCNSVTGVFHNPVSVTDNNACTTDACNSTTGAITHIAVAVDDQNACTTDACNSTTGAITHTAVPVDDGNVCTTDACNSVTGAITHNAANIDDGNACTTDACNSTSGGITHTPTNVDDQNPCTTDACNSITGAITHTTVNVEDNNACTTDGCNSVTGVFHNPINVNDQNACTTDACNSVTGAITHTAVNTDDQNACTVDACNSTTGAITHTAANIDDQNACTVDACNSSTGAITHTPTNTNDGNACTNDFCNSTTGAITHPPVDIDDNNICTTDGCDTQTGVFHNTIPGCSNVCDVPPTANGGGPYYSCGNPQLNGSVGGSATGGTWSSQTGGTFSPNANDLHAFYIPSAADISAGAVILTLTSNNPNGAPCTTATSTAFIFFLPVDDNNACTIDGCNSVTGAITHVPVVIFDNNACTIDACNPATGVITHVPVNPNDNNVCTTDGCDTQTGMYNVPINVSDGNACTTDGCTTPGGVFHTPVNVDDGIACTLDACNTATGAITHTNSPPVVTATPGVINCYSGSTCVSVTATGGVPPYSGTGLLCGYPAGDYSFDVTDSRGCTGTSQSINIPEPQKISVTVSSTPSDCSINNGTATAFVTGGVPGYSYLWTPGGQTTNPATGLAAGTYNVKITDKNGCVVNQLVAVGLTGGTPPTPSQITGPNGVCKKQTGIVYCVTPIPGNNNYIWSLPKGISVVGPSNGPCITVKVSTKFKNGFICVKVDGPCGTSQTVCKTIVMVKKKPAPPAAINGPITLCPLATGAYSIAPMADVTGYIWSGNNGLLIISGQGTTNVIVKAPANFKEGDLKVKAINCKGNGGDRALKISNKLEKPNIIKPGGSVCKSSSKAYSADPVPGVTYLWTATNGVVISSGQGTANVIVKFTGATLNKTVLTVTITNACGTSQSKSENIDINMNCRVADADVNSNSGIEELTAFNAYPNPTSGKVTVTFNSAGEVKYSVRVVNILGKVIINENISSIEGYNSKEIDLSNSAKGIYMISIQTEGRDAKTLRIIVE